MAVATPTSTIADLLHDLAGVSPSRVLIKPAPGTATEQDAVDLDAHHGRLCELVDGVLVEKGMGYIESLLAAALIRHLGSFVATNNLGIVSAHDGMMRLFPGLVRIPDVAFTSWTRLPGGKIPRDAIAGFAPDLAVDVLSQSNTQGEMQRKRQEYFDAGVQLVWIVDPPTRTITVYNALESSRTLSESDTVDGGNVLAGFTLAVANLFSELDRQSP